MDRLDLSPEELLTTTRTVRKRLDLSRPVSREVVEACLRLAFQAPNGGNQQAWGWVVVDDAATKTAMAGIYRQALSDYVNRPRTSSDYALPDTLKQRRMTESVMYLNEHFHEVPVLLVPTFHGFVQDQGLFAQASSWGSIAPAVWSFMLALRLHGMGSAWTTLHLLRADEMAQLLGIPDTETQAGMFPVAYTLGTDFKPADRSASDARIFWNRWGA